MKLTRCTACRGKGRIVTVKHIPGCVGTSLPHLAPQTRKLIGNCNACSGMGYSDDIVRITLAIDPVAAATMIRDFEVENGIIPVFAEGPFVELRADENEWVDRR